MAKSKIIPSRAVSNRNIGGSSIAPGETISGQTNDQKIVVDGRQYDGGNTETAKVRVNKENYIIYADVLKTPGKLVITLPDGEHQVEFDGSVKENEGNIVRVRLDDYSLRELSAHEGELKRYTLLKNGEPTGNTIIVPKDTELENEVANKEDKTTYRIGNKSILNNFVFINNEDVTCNAEIDEDITLTIDDTIEQGFISMLTISSVEANKTITFENLSDYNLRVVYGISVQSGNAFVTRSTGKKIIFAKCDGVDIEILIVEELSNE